MANTEDRESQYGTLPSVLALRSVVGLNIARQQRHRESSSDGDDMYLRKGSNRIAPAGSSGDYVGSRRASESYKRRMSTLSIDEAITQLQQGDDDINLEDLGLKRCEDNVERMEQLAHIRNMPCPISIKRALRAKVMSQQTRILAGFKGWKIKQKMEYIKCKLACMNAGYKLELWGSSFKEIEGHFGSGVLSYFVFLKWLFQLNILICAMILLFIVAPQAYSNNNTTSYTEPCTSSSASNDSRYDVVWYGDIAPACTQNYENYLGNLLASNYNGTTSAVNYVADFFQGTGFMENTVLFYGFYSSADLNVTVAGLDSQHSYSISLAFITVTGVYFVISLILMVRQSAKGFKETIISSEGRFYQYCNSAFGTWDYTLNDVKNVQLKKKSIFNEIQHDLHEARDRKRRTERTTGQRCRLWTLRVSINIFVLAALGSSAYLIFYLTQLNLEIVNTNTDYQDYHVALKLLIQFMPSLTITVLNLLVPQIFDKVVLGEDYTPAVEIRITLIRTVFLRLASLAVLMWTLYAEITCTEKDSCNLGIGACQPLYCWETGIGQELYKLVILDLMVKVAITIVVEFPRKLIVSKCSCKVAKMIGYQQFVIPKNVLDLVYSQTLCWLGAFFSPLIPTICVLKFFILFYVQKTSLLSNYVPNSRPYRASRSNSFFVIVLLISFILCCFPILYVIISITPSRGCGPFRQYGAMFEAVIATACDWPTGFQNFLNIVTSVGFNYPVIIILCLAIYYQHMIASAQKQKVVLLKDQLLMEGKDKQYLLAKLNEVQGKGQSEEKKLISKRPMKTNNPPVSQRVINEEAGMQPEGSKGSIQTVSSINPSLPPPV